MYQTRAWRNYCDRFLTHNPECYACGKPAVAVDHLTPHQGDDKLFKKLDNHIPLCKSCHSYVTAKYDMRYVQGNSIDEKIKWLNHRRMPSDSWIPKKVRVMAYYEE